MEIWAKNVKGGSVKVGIFGNDKWDHCQKTLKITFLTDAPFLVKFRFEKYRYLLSYLQCIQIFEASLSDSHSTGPPKKGGRLVPLPVLSDDAVISSPNIWWSETDQILNAKYFVWKNYTLEKWGLRKACNQNSLMQLFNGNRRIVQWIRLF